MLIMNRMAKRKKANIKNRCNQVPHLTRDTIWESDKTTREIHIQEGLLPLLSQQVLTWLQGTDKTV